MYDKKLQVSTHRRTRAMCEHHRKFICETIDRAQQNAAGITFGPFAAIVTGPDGTVIGRGDNRVWEDLDPSAHAEVVAMRAACKTLGRPDLSGCTLYTSSEPCEQCTAVMKGANISLMVYAATHAQAREGGFADGSLNTKVVPMLRIEHPDSARPFVIWNKNPDKRMYFEKAK